MIDGGSACLQDIRDGVTYCLRMDLALWRARFILVHNKDHRNCTFHFTHPVPSAGYHQYDQV